MKPKKNTWCCPKCGVESHKHPKSTKHRRSCVEVDGNWCEGMLCECDDTPGQEREPGSDPDAKDHGLTQENPCANANCYHCGWDGRLPAKEPKKKAEKTYTASEVLEILEQVSRRWPAEESYQAPLREVYKRFGTEAPQQAETPNHDWVKPPWAAVAFCRKCMVVCRADGGNQPCPGIVKLVLRKGRKRVRKA